MTVKVFFIQNDCLCNRNRRSQSPEYPTSFRKHFPIGSPQFKLVSGILFQINDAAAKLQFFKVMNRRKPGNPFPRFSFPDIRQHILSGSSGPVIRTSAKQRNQLQFRFRRSKKRRNQHKAKDKKAFHVQLLSVNFVNSFFRNSSQSSLFKINFTSENVTAVLECISPVVIIDKNMQIVPADKRLIQRQHPVRSFDIIGNCKGTAMEMRMLFGFIPCIE